MVLKKKKRLLITGSYGQVGSELQKLSDSYQGYEFDFQDIDTLDITSEAQVNAQFEENSYHFCINCAAYTQVDKAENEPMLAFAVNTKAVGILAESCKKYNCRLIHISTDYVYDNGLRRPLLESDPTIPKSVYAKSKLDGEKLALVIDPATIIVRSSWVYSAYGHNFVKTILRLADRGDQLTVVEDQIGCPTYAKGLAEAILTIIQKCENSPGIDYAGIYNFCSHGQTSWLELAVEICKLRNITCEIQGITTSAYGSPAPRPAYSVLDCKKILETFGIKTNYWKEELEKCLLEIKALNS
jgi:dTDP-4-dehydrorhamnose reductase